MLDAYRMWAEWLEAFPSSTAIRESLYGYPALLASHVIGMCLFAGLVLMMDLRLVGIGNPRTPFSQLQKKLFPWQMVGMVISAVTGFILVYGQPTRYYTNIFFWLKTVMMMLAGVNALAFHWSTYFTVDRWDADRLLLPRSAKTAGAVSVVLWLAVIVTGRLIAYNWFNLQ